MADATLKVIGDVLHVEGNLSLKQATPLLKSAIQMMQDNQIKQVDFTATKDSDTTGILLMLKLQRLAKQSLSFINVPERLRGLLSLSNLTKILTITS